MTVQAISPNRIQSAIANAAQRTGIDFDYLLGQAKLESGLNASARAGTSSASGLYQFIEQSWLSVVKKHGAENGLGWAADAIGGAGGRLSVADAGTRQAILALRNDPEVSSMMAAAYAGDNKAGLEGTIGREATGTDLYMAHFLGLGGARKFLSAMQANGDTSGAALFPAAAASNRGVFFNSNGTPRTLSQIYQRFADKLGAGAESVSETRSANLQFAARALKLGDDTEVVTGANESADSALAWASSTLGHYTQAKSAAATMLRPTPDTARLAYMMLASLGN